MLNKEDFKNPICMKWKNINFDHNFLDTKTDQMAKMDFDSFMKLVAKECGNKKIVVTWGHLIPNIRDYDSVWKNPMKTWLLACTLVGYLKNEGLDAKLSFILNDIDLTIGAREKLFNKFLRLPKPYIEIMRKNWLSPDKDLLHCSFNNDEVFSEKKLSNRTRYLVRRKQILNKKFEGENHCHSALISYFIDLSEQNIDVSVALFPICSRCNIKQSVDLCQKLNPKLRHICFFETNNCFS